MENEYIIKVIREMCARHSCQGNVICRALVNVGKLDSWEDGIKHPIDATFAQDYGVIVSNDEGDEDEDVMETEREEDMEEMKMVEVVDEGGRCMVVL